MEGITNPISAASPAARHPQSRFEPSFPTPKFEPQTSISNRHIPELESPVSHRKQSIGPLSNRHKFAFCNFRLLPFPASLPLCVLASSPSLIANDMHSREESSPCKQTTYNFLIANEIHSRKTRFSLSLSLPQRAQLARNVHCMAHGMVYVMAARSAYPPQAGAHAQRTKSGGEERSE